MTWEPSRLLSHRREVVGVGGCSVQGDVLVHLAHRHASCIRSLMNWYRDSVIWTHSLARLCFIELFRCYVRLFLLLVFHSLDVLV